MSESCIINTYFKTSGWYNTIVKKLCGFKVTKKKNVMEKQQIVPP